MDNAVEYLLTLKGSDGKLVPILYRPISRIYRKLVLVVQKYYYPGSSLKHCGNSRYSTLRKKGFITLFMFIIHRIGCATKLILWNIIPAMNG